MIFRIGLWNAKASTWDKFFYHCSLKGVLNMRNKVDIFAYFESIISLVYTVYWAIHIKITFFFFWEPRSIKAWKIYYSYIVENKPFKLIHKWELVISACFHCQKKSKRMRKKRYLGKFPYLSKPTVFVYFTLLKAVSISSFIELIVSLNCNHSR